MALPRGIHRITKTYFRTCSTYMSRSQAHLYLYALQVIANHPECTIALLRYSLGGDRPSQTTHLTLSPSRVHGLRLESKHDKSGISPVTPQGLASLVQRLPPILHIRYLDPVLGYSKGSRGLSVLLRVCGIFTTTTISPSLLSRQCRSRYAIRAGRKLPDKEFRYLRTVIVTAALHRRFGSQLRPKANRLP